MDSEVSQTEGILVPDFDCDFIDVVSLTPVGREKKVKILEPWEVIDSSPKVAKSRKRQGRLLKSILKKTSTKDSPVPCTIQKEKNETLSTSPTMGCPEQLHPLTGLSTPGGTMVYVDIEGEGTQYFIQDSGVLMPEPNEMEKLQASSLPSPGLSMPGATVPYVEQAGDGIQLFIPDSGVPMPEPKGMDKLQASTLPSPGLSTPGATVPYVEQAGDGIQLFIPDSGDPSSETASPSRPGATVPYVGEAGDGTQLLISRNGVLMPVIPPSNPEPNKMVKLPTLTMSGQGLSTPVATMPYGEGAGDGIQFYIPGSGVLMPGANGMQGFPAFTMSAPGASVPGAIPDLSVPGATGPYVGHAIDRTPFYIPGNGVLIPGPAGGMLAHQIHAAGTGLPQGLFFGASSLLSPWEITDEAQKKRIVRLMKNRAAAKACRIRRKQYITQLESNKTVLETKVKQLMEEVEFYRSKPTSESFN
ncbi:transcription factor JunD-like isoform X2 [Dendropsophus ebraccatus]|uniref:transcription factor JunD-like isoform X2 n=1 Tax=Dendropsophus ebraccatus TaxID=150705 RepID=UPI0038317DDE